jgi:hypothetical protein
MNKTQPTETQINEWIERMRKHAADLLIQRVIDKETFDDIIRGIVVQAARKRDGRG